MKRGSTFYLRMRVPPDLVEVEGKKFIQVSLKTKDPDEARRLNSQKQAELRERWSRMRLGVIVLDDRQIEALSGEVYEKVRDYFGKDRSLWVTHSRAGALWCLEMAMGEFPVPENGEVDSWGMTESIVGPPVKAVLDKHGLRVDQRSWRRLLWAGARAAKQAMELILKEGEGDYTGDPKANRFPKLELPEGVGNAEDEEKRRRRSTKLLDVWNDFLAARKTSENTKKKWRPILNDMATFCGTDDLKSITEERLCEWCDALVRRGLTAENVKDNYLQAAKSIFGFAHRNRRLAENVAKNVHVETPRGSSDSDKRGLSLTEATAILSAALSFRAPRMSPKRVAAHRWAPWIMAYTGARVNEVTQLRACDVGVVDGVWCFTFTPEGGTIKGNKPRYVPIHPHLIEQGFLDYAASFDGATPLFHNSASTDPKKLAKAAEAIGGHLASWVRELGVTGPDVAPNHGWRHRFASYAPTLMQEIQLNNIQGHAPATAGRRYIKIPPSELAPVIQRIPRYDIPGAGTAKKPERATKRTAEEGQGR